MIQPLDTSRNSWRLLWFDLDEPVPRPSLVEEAQGLPAPALTIFPSLKGLEYYLPTCMLVTTASGKPLSAPEILEELDQPRAEQLLGRLFEEHGTPDRYACPNPSTSRRAPGNIWGSPADSGDRLSMLKGVDFPKRGEAATNR